MGASMPPLGATAHSRLVRPADSRGTWLLGNQFLVARVLFMHVCALRRNSPQNPIQASPRGWGWTFETCAVSKLQS